MRREPVPVLCVNFQGAAGMQLKALAKIPAKAVAALPTDDVPPAQPAGGLLAEQHITILLVGIGLRLTRSASAYYRSAFDLGMAEWRLLQVLRNTEALNVGELSAAADPDKAAVSRSLVLLGERKLVSVTQTRTRGRAAIAELTPEGKKLSARLMQVSLQRQESCSGISRKRQGAPACAAEPTLQDLTGDWEQ